MARGDLPALTADQAEDAILATKDTAYEGKDAVQGYSVGAFASMPNMKIAGTGEHANGDVVLCTWTGDSLVASAPAGQDTFVIREDRIRLQTCWFTVVPK